MPNTTLTNQPKPATVTLLKSTAGGPPAPDTASTIQSFLTQGAGIVSLSPPPNTPTTARTIVVSPVAVGSFVITVAGPGGSQDQITGNVVPVPDSWSLTVQIDP